MASPALSAAVKSAAFLAGVAGAALAAASCNGGGGDRAGLDAGHRAPSASPAAGPGVVPGVPSGPRLLVPAVIDIPYVVAGQGASTVTIVVENRGDAPLTGLAFRLSGDPSISLGAVPSSLDPGARAEVALTWAGSATEVIAQANLSVATAESRGGSTDVPVFAVAGDPGLGAAAWDDVEGAGGVRAGTGTTVSMPAAPYPDGASKYTDASVRVFLPEGYRDRGAHDLVTHFHGWNTTVASTLATHLYQQHVYASGSNAVLIVPQGPVDAPSGDFGKLMARGGLTRLLTEVLVLLYREGKITHPVRGDLAVTAHSGGYQAVAAALDPANQAPKIAQVGLYDSLYGYDALFEAFALGGGALRSSYTDGGGTLDENQAVAAHLAQKGARLTTVATRRARRDEAPILHYEATTHDGTTRLDGAYGEDLRWRMRHSRRGPRLELRELTAVPRRPDTAVARWLAPADEDVRGFVVETSTDGVTWATVASVTKADSEATFALPPEKGVRARVKAVVKGVPAAEVLPSNTYRVDRGARVLVVDGFDRVLDGSFGGLQHDFAAVVGEALGVGVAGISHRAVTEDGFDLTAWPAVVWLLGDASTMDRSLSAAEQAALRDYVDGGGHLVVSGSELAFDVGQTPAGADFLRHCFGAMFVADDSGSHEVAAQGPLAGVASFAFGGGEVRGARYAAASPDALAATPAGDGAEAGVVLLEYGSAQAAAVGVPGRAALVGFPLELTAPEPALAGVTRALLAFAGGP